MGNEHANRKHKDTIFRMLFKQKQEMLELYNAVNDTGYEDPDELKVVTLENAIYMTVKNDLSCILDMRLQIFEHQSTINPNMPLRFLQYILEQYNELIADKDIYSRKRIKLPTPKFFVFYNGTDRQPDVRIMKLSESFEIPDLNPSLELTVVQYNINSGHNAELFSKCPTLFQYMQFIDCVRQHPKNMFLEKSVKEAINECIKNGILADFLKKNKTAVIKMFLYEYDEEKHKKTLYNEGYEDGAADGETRGIEIGKSQGIGIGVNRILESLLADGIINKEIAAKYTK